MQKRLANISFIYAVLAMVCGVFYRTYTQAIGFTGATRLSVLHTHLFMLGMVFFLLVLFADRLYSVSAHRRFGAFLVVYNTGLIITAIALFARGMVQTMGGEVTRGLDFSLSGVAGTGHIVLGVGLVQFLLLLKKSVAAAH